MLDTHIYEITRVQSKRDGLLITHDAFDPEKVVGRSSLLQIKFAAGSALRLRFSENLLSWSPDSRWTGFSLFRRMDCCRHSSKLKAVDTQLDYEDHLNTKFYFRRYKQIICQIPSAELHLFISTNVGLYNGKHMLKQFKFTGLMNLL